MKPLWIGLAATIAAALLSLTPSPCSGHEAGAAHGGQGLADAGAPKLEAPDTPRLAIEAARDDGRIGFEEEILLKAYALYAPEKLPEEYRRGGIEKCGTLLAREIGEALPDLPADVAAEISRMRQRPVCDSYYDTARFRIHYDTSGPHMILGWPDTSYRDAIGAAAEKSWTDEVTTLGFRAPPSDGSDPDGGDGSGLYDIYVQALAGYHGYCQGAWSVPGPPGLPYDCTSYVVIDNDYAGFGYPDPQDPMKVTVAHEFCHSCQFASNYNAPGWYMECTSTWCEDAVYPTINDYIAYIPYFYNFPHLSLEVNQDPWLRIYGSCVWNFFISEFVDDEIVPTVWAALEDTFHAHDAYYALDERLTAEGTSLEEAYGDFAVWNWFTGSRDDGGHYVDGALWPLVPTQATYSGYPVSGGSPPGAYLPDHMGWNYVHFNNPGYAEDLLDVSYDGPAPATTPNRAFVNLKTTSRGTSEHGELSLDVNGEGATTVTDWDTYSTVCLVVVNTSQGADSMNYTFGADKSSPVEGAFYAAVTGRESVTLRWTLADPWGIVSLDVLRSTDGGRSYERLNASPLEPLSPGSYVDIDVRPGEELWYKLVATLTDGTQDVVDPGVISARVDGTLGLALSPPMPNPFSGSASFEYTVPQDGGPVTLVVYDLAGRRVRTLEEGVPGRGRYTSAWDGVDEHGRRVAAGVYFVTLEVPGAVMTQKALLLK